MKNFPGGLRYNHPMQDGAKNTPSKWPGFERRVRIVTGVIIAIYVIPHLFNHMLGLVSFEAMETVRPVLASFWQWTPIWWVLPTVLITHPLFSMMAVCRRSTLRMPPAELSQILLGLAVPLLLLGHVVATRVTRTATDVDTNYNYVLASMAADDFGVVMQSVLVLVVWFHLCIGVHMWLRFRKTYRRIQPVLYPLAVMWPVLALVGYWRALAEMRVKVSDVDFKIEVFKEWSKVDPDLRLALGWLEEILIGLFVVLVGAAFLLRLLARWRRRSRIGAFIRHSSGKQVAIDDGQSILEAMRVAGINHASMCGGRARCTTCRVEVSEGLQSLPAPTEMEATALSRIQAGPRVRLACQTYPNANVSITPLVDPRTVTSADDGRRGGVAGAEREVVAMFVDLRESTKLAEDKLPYDVVFILNRFFAEMSDALDETGGHYAQFAGDGLLALYGLETDLQTAAGAALDGAQNMMDRIERLNDEISSELARPLRIGIGIHAGEAIVGDMGPPSTPIRSAIGDNINIAARLEAMTKDLGARLVVSTTTVELANRNYSMHRQEDVEIRGRRERLPVFAVE